MPRSSLLENEIDIRIVGALGGCARADLEIERVALRLVDEVMAVRRRPP